MHYNSILHVYDTSSCILEMCQMSVRIRMCQQLKKIPAIDLVEHVLKKLKREKTSSPWWHRHTTDGFPVKFYEWCVAEIIFKQKDTLPWENTKMQTVGLKE